MTPRAPWRLGVGSMVWASAAAVGLLGCRPEEPPRAVTRPSVIVITVDTLRADRLSCYGYRPRQTPGICALARDGALFERAVCDVPWTTGSMASVLTGQYAALHRVRLPTDRLSDAAVTLAEVLRERGYATGAILGSFPLASIYNLNQGFQDYDDDFDTPMMPMTPGEPLKDYQGRPRTVQKIPPLLSAPPEEMQRYFAEKVTNDAFRPDDRVTDRAIAWLARHRNQDFFLWVHYFGPHERINLAETWEAQSPRVIADYDRDLAFTDEQVGRLLAAIDTRGLRDHTLVILHADHGQSLGENDYVGHGDNLYQPTLHIPLLMRLPGHVDAGVRVAALAQNVDIFPTVLALLGISTDLSLSGADLSPLVRAGAAPGAGPVSERPAYSETLASRARPHAVDIPGHGPATVHMERFGLLHGRRMYVINELTPPCVLANGTTLPDAECAQIHTEELFDPFGDPQGLHNLMEQEAERLAWFRDALATQRRVAGHAAEPIQLSPADRDKLRALGYNN